jgi:hypothetical protein
MGSALWIPQESSRVLQFREKWKPIGGFVPERSVIQFKDRWHSVMWKKESGWMNDFNIMMNI